MSFSQQFAPQVLHDVRSRGRSYFLSGAVRSLEVEDGGLHAEVRGSETYHVWFVADDERLEGTCTCPFFEDRGELCKHMWATLLAIDEQPALASQLAETFAGVPQLSPRTLAVAPNAAARAEEARSPIPSRAPAASAKPAPWRQLLENVAAAGSVAPATASRSASGQLLYIVDAAASTAAGVLVVELMSRDRKANGDWGKPRPAKVSTGELTAVSSAVDRELLDRLSGARAHFEWGGYSAIGHEMSRLQLRGALARDLMPRLCATGRCHLRVVAGSGKHAQAMLTPLVWDQGGPWSLAIDVEQLNDKGYRVTGSFTRDTARMQVTEPELVIADGLLFAGGVVARVDLGAGAAWANVLRRTAEVHVPLEGRESLLDALLGAPPVHISAPEDLRVEVVSGRPQLRLRLRTVPDRDDALRAELSFDYGGHVVLDGEPGRVIRRPGDLRAIERDAEAERGARDVLSSHGARQEWLSRYEKPALMVSASQVPALTRRLLLDGWQVEAYDALYRTASGVNLDVRSGIDWFELHGQVTFGDQQAPLPKLLAALERGESFVALEDGTVGLIPETWLKRHGLLTELGTAEEGHVRFARSQAALLDALLAAQPQATWDETFERTREALQGFEGIKGVDPSPAFHGTLRGYQREGLGWLLFLRRLGFGGCLADDMGLGKTVMVLALLTMPDEEAEREHRPSLVVAPRSLIFNWRQEASRFAPGLRVLEYVGAGRQSMREQFGEVDLVLTTYGTLRNDAAALAATPFNYVILDEAQAIKNAATVSAKTTRLLNTRHRLALSGTPIENHLGEIWSLFEFLNPGLLSTAAAFKRVRGADRLDPEALALLSRALRPFLLRRTKEQVASDLPPKTEQTISCELEPRQRTLYNELRDHYRQKLLAIEPTQWERSRFQVLEALLRLRQAACHPGLIDPEMTAEPSAKLDLLVPRLVEASEEGHKTLVFSQFTSLLAILRERLDAQKIPYQYLDGRTRDREERVQQFQEDPECRLFLISLKAGGVGLNLTAAEYVFLLDPWWNPAVEAQAIDRAHRIGQGRHVFAYRLIARETVEERVLELQERKRDLADAILSAENSGVRDLKREDLELLLS